MLSPSRDKPLPARLALALFLLAGPALEAQEAPAEAAVEEPVEEPKEPFLHGDLVFGRPLRAGWEFELTFEIAPIATAINEVARQQLSDEALPPDVAGVLEERLSATSFNLIPSAQVAFYDFAIRLDVPLSGAVREGSSSFAIGNLGLEMKRHFVIGDIFGITPGMALAFPTAGDDALAGSEVSPLRMALFSPHTFTVAPELILGLDISMFIIQTYLMVEAVVPTVKDGRSTAAALDFGTSLIFNPISFIQIFLEMDGRREFWGDDRIFVFLSPGLRVDIYGFRIALAIQLPLVDQFREDPISKLLKPEDLPPEMAGQYDQIVETAIPIDREYASFNFVATLGYGW